MGTCSPRMHEITFRKLSRGGGAQPYLLVANLREQCAWVHKDKERLARRLFPDPCCGSQGSPQYRAGAGRSAGDKEPWSLGAALPHPGRAGHCDAGYQVDLVEKEPSIGGRMSQLDKTFPTLDCSACILTPKMVDLSSNEKINLYTYSEVEKIEGYVGNFTVTIRQKARSVDMDKCTGCGVCWEKCPTRVESEFDCGLDKRKAIYVPFPQAVPNACY